MLYTLPHRSNRKDWRDAFARHLAGAACGVRGYDVSDERHSIRRHIDTPPNLAKSLTFPVFQLVNGPTVDNVKNVV